MLSFLIGLFLISNEDIFEIDEDLPEELIHREILEELVKNPIDLNKATVEDLLKIPYLDPVLAKRIVENRKYKKINDLLKIRGFDIPSYYTKIYAYEHSLPGQGRSYSFYGKGWRGYALLGIGFKKLFFLSLKYGMTIKDDERIYDLSSQIEIRI